MTIDGTVIVRFITGFAPQQGEEFGFLQAGGLIDLSGASFDIQNLAPGFLFDISPKAGGVVLTALTNGVFVPEPRALLLAALGTVAAARGSRGRKRRAVATRHLR
jgi:hypothetical protein